MSNTSTFPICWGVRLGILDYQTTGGVSITSANVNTTIAIIGRTFGNVSGTVTLAGTTLTVSKWNDTEIDVSIPAGAAFPITQPFVVTTVSPIRTTFTGANFTINGPATITSYQTVGGASITDAQPYVAVNILGTDFGPASGSVTFSGLPSTLTSWTDTKIGSTVPVSGTYPVIGPVVVTNTAGSVGTGANFTIDTPYVGQAAHFGGNSNSYLTTSSTTNLQIGTGTGFTMAAWVNPNSMASNAALLGIDYIGADGSWGLGIDTVLGFRWTIGAGGNIFNAGTAGTAGVWQLVVCQMTTTGSIKISVNNGTVTTVAVAGSEPANNTSFYLGHGVNGPLAYNGSLDEVALWQRVLTPAEITSLYNLGVGINYYDARTTYPALLTSLRAWWDLNDTTWVDSSVNAINLTAGSSTPTNVTGVR